MTRHIVTHADGAVDEIRQTWRTPPDLAATLITRYGITLDVAAHRGNAIVPAFLGPGSSITSDALSGPAWGYHAPRYALSGPAWDYHAPRHADEVPGAAFCNPPFRLAPRFVDAGIDAVTHRGRPLRAVVYLLPCNLDTRWARRLWEHGAAFHAIHGRLTFAPPVDETGAPIPGIDAHRGAAFPMMVVVLDGARARVRTLGSPEVHHPPLSMIDKKGNRL